MRKIWVAGVALFLASCHTIIPEMDAALQSQYGEQPIDAFIIAHGPPTSVTTIGDGRQVMDWRLGETMTRRGLGNEHVYCQVRAVVSPRQEVESIEVVETTGSTGMRFTRCGEVLNINQ